MYEYNAIIDHIHDADTLYLRIDLGLETYRLITVRLHGIDAPELSTIEGLAAKVAVQDLITKYGNQVFIRTHKDKREKYGRYLVEVYWPRDIGSLNDWLINQGFAKPYDGGKR